MLTLKELSITEIQRVKYEKDNYPKTVQCYLSASFEIQSQCSERDSLCSP